MRDNTPAPRHGGTDALWPALIVLMVAITQIGAISHEVLNWDESTFVLMGESLLDGHLPFVEMFDVKPPGIFVALAGVMALFGSKSVVAVRLFGDLCLLLAVLLGYLVARRMTGAAAAGLGQLLAVAMAALPFAGQAVLDPGLIVALHTSTELPATALLMAALWLAVTRPAALWAAGLAGLCVSLAVLTRSNLVFAAVAFGLHFLVGGLRRGSAVPATAVVVYTLSGLAPLLALTAVYATAGAFSVLWLAMVSVPLAYAGEQLTMLQSGLGHLRFLAIHAMRAPWLVAPVVLLTAVGLLRVASRLPGRQAAFPGSGLTLLVFLATFLSVLNSGADYPHYWMQFLPMTGVFIAIAVQWGLDAGRAAGTLAAGLAVIGSVGAGAASLPETVRVLTRPGYLDERYHIRRAAAAFADRDDIGEVWTIYNQLFLWYADLPTVSKVTTHPSNIVRRPIVRTLARQGYLPENELGRVMDSLPAMIVSDTDRSPDYIRHRRIDLDAYLSDGYALSYRSGTVLVYLRRDLAE